MFLSDYFFEDRRGIKLLSVKSQKEAEEAVKKIVYGSMDKTSALFLSGGKAPKDLYYQMAEDKKLIAGAVGLVDERFGERLHDASNEKMIRETGLLNYFSEANIQFYPILHGEKIEKETEDYDETLRYLFSYFPRSLAILGIGDDGHTAGLPAGNQKLNLKSQISRKILSDPSSLATYYSDPKKYGDRITMTFLALSRIDVLLLYVLGTEKRNALKSMFVDGPIEQVPARFYLRPDIASKTILVTDQIV